MMYSHSVCTSVSDHAPNLLTGCVSLKGGRIAKDSPFFLKSITSFHYPPRELSPVQLVVKYGFWGCPDISQLSGCQLPAKCPVGRGGIPQEECSCWGLLQQFFRVKPQTHIPK